MQASEINGDIQHDVPASETDQAKLLLELQKENRDLRVQLARQQQKLLSLQVHSLAANTSSTPSSVNSFVTPPSSAQPIEKQKPRSSFLARSCFTPESKKKGAEETVRELRQTLKALETEMERMKKEHIMQLKLKDDLIIGLSRKNEKTPKKVGMEGTKRVVTRASLLPKEPRTGELKIPSHRFRSPTPTTKKRSFWDITTVNSPSVIATLNGRKTRSHAVSKASSAAPSMLLQVLCTFFVVSSCVKRNHLEYQEP